MEQIRLLHRERSIHSRRDDDADDDDEDDDDRRRQRTENEKNRLRIGFVMLSGCACKNQSHKATPLKTQYATNLSLRCERILHISLPLHVCV